MLRSRNEALLEGSRLLFKLGKGHSLPPLVKKPASVCWSRELLECAPIEDFGSKEYKVDKSLRKEPEPSSSLAFKSENRSQYRDSFRQFELPLATLTLIRKWIKDAKKAPTPIETIVQIELPKVVFEANAPGQRESNEKRGIVILMSPFPGGGVDFIEGITFDLFD
jgi:hypothetical protein